MKKQQDNSPEKANDVLGKATEALRETHVPEGPPAAVIEALLAADGQSENHKQTRFQMGRSKMNRIMKIAATILIVIGVGIAIALLTQSNGTASVAWADVQERIRRVQTLTFRGVMHQEGVDNMIINAMVMEPGLVRQEIVVGPQRITHIMNMNERKILILTEEDKTAVRINVPGLPEKLRKKYEDSDMLASFKEMIEESESELGERMIGGRLAKGYRVEKDMRAMNIWVDARTAEPLEMKLEMYGPEVHVTLSDFEFDKELDEALFSLEKPAGYKEVAEMEIGDASTEDLAEFFRFWAEARGGTFPETLSEVEWIQDCTNYIKTLEKKMGQEELFARATVWGRARLFLQVRPETQYHYAGKGVAMGDAGKAVFWYKPEGSDTYRVIYGDLSIKEVGEGDLPR